MQLYRRSAASCISWILLPNSRLSLGVQRELKTSAEVMGGLVSGRLTATFDLVAQRFRTVASAQHLEVLPGQRSSTTTPDMRAAMFREEKKCLRGRWENRPRKLGGAIEERLYPDPENNVGRGALSSAITNAGRKGKPRSEIATKSHSIKPRSGGPRTRQGPTTEG